MSTSASPLRRGVRAAGLAAALALATIAVVSATPPALAAPVPGMAAAPCEYFGWGNPQDPTTVMARTGIRWFTLAFILSDGGCNPKWDGRRGLTGGVDQANINKIRARGGDVVVSFGGWAGTKLGEKCSTAAALAGAYQKVINAYRHIGISSMNGKAGAGERVSVADFKNMLAYANLHHLARFTYWAVNRDRPCGGANNNGDSCSGIAQQPYDFTKVIASYAG